MQAESSSGNYIYTVFDGSGAVTNDGTQTFSLVSHYSTNIGNGWYRAYMIFTTDGISDLTISVSLGNSSSGGTTYTGNGSNGAFMTRMQLSYGTTAVKYIKN
jgi:hypothetical protein